MCFVNEVATPEVVVLDFGTTPTSPWRKLKQQMKPKLSRVVVNSAKINLNKYWSKFEHLSINKLPLMTLLLEDNPVRDNEINDNIANEKKDC